MRLDSRFDLLTYSSEGSDSSASDANSLAADPLTKLSESESPM